MVDQRLSHKVFPSPTRATATITIYLLAWLCVIAPLATTAQAAMDPVEETALWDILEFWFGYVRLDAVSPCEAHPDLVGCDETGKHLVSAYLEQQSWLPAQPFPDFSVFPHLSYLDISGNNFVGQMSPDHVALTKLEQVYLSFNDFEGEFPEWILELPEIETFHCTTCNLREIPATLGANWPNFVTLDLSLNSNLQGAFPSGLRTAQDIFLVDCNLEGDIPEHIWSFDLIHLGLSGNSFTGTPQFEKLTNVVMILARDNKFSGQLSPQMSELPALRRVEVQNNDFDGPIPTFDASLESLMSLDLSGNNFDGSIPATLGNATNLLALKLNSNSLSGFIPDSLAQLTSLETLDLSNNQLEGELPDYLGAVAELGTVTLDGNAFRGQIPNSYVPGLLAGSITLVNNELNCPLPLELFQHLDNTTLSEFCGNDCPQGEESTLDKGCSPCARGYFKSTEGTLPCLPCPASTFSVEEGTISCEPCPASDIAICMGEDKILWFPGWWHPEGNLKDISECKPDACQGGEGGTIECRINHTGPICGTCVIGTFHSGGVCAVCPEIDENWAYLAMILFVIVVVVVFLVRRQLRSKQKQRSLLIGAFKQLVTYLQLTSLAKGFNSDWPSTLTALFVASGSASGMSQSESVFSIDCLFDRYSILTDFSTLYRKLIFWLVIPSAWILLSAFWFGVSAMREKGKPVEDEGDDEDDDDDDEDVEDNHNSTMDSVATSRSGYDGPSPSLFVASTTNGGRDGSGNKKEEEEEEKKKKKKKKKGPKRGAWSRFLLTTYVMTFLLYPPVSQAILNIFACRTLESGEVLLEHDLSLTCGDSSHVLWMLLCGLPAAILWIIGVPLSAFYNLYTNRHRLTDKTVRAKFGLFYKGFKPKYYYYDLLIKLRKIVVVMIVVFLSRFGAQIQLYAVVLALMLALVVQLGTEPYESPALQRMDVLSLTCIIFTLWSGQLFAMEDRRFGETARTILAWTVLIIDVAVIGLFLLIAADQVRETKMMRRFLGEKRYSIAPRGFRSDSIVRSVPTVSADAEELESLREHIARLEEYIDNHVIGQVDTPEEEDVGYQQRVGFVVAENTEAVARKHPRFSRIQHASSASPSSSEGASVSSSAVTPSLDRERYW